MSKIVRAENAKQNSNDGMWSVELAVYDTESDGDKELFRFESAPVFNSGLDALVAGDRAVIVFKNTGKFPNMCEAF